MTDEEFENALKAWHVRFLIMGDSKGLMPIPYDWPRAVAFWDRHASPHREDQIKWIENHFKATFGHD